MQNRNAFAVEIYMSFRKIPASLARWYLFLNYDLTELVYGTILCVRPVPYMKVEHNKGGNKDASKGIFIRGRV